LGDNRRGGREIQKVSASSDLATLGKQSERLFEASKVNLRQ
jgi:hypothetical protein